MWLFETVNSALPARMSMPTDEIVPLKKSKTLLASTTFARLRVLLPAVPSIVIALVGRFAPAGPMLLLAMVLLLLPTRLVPFVVVVLNRTAPVATPGPPVDEPRMVEFLTVLF